MELLMIKILKTKFLTPLSLAKKKKKKIVFENSALSQIHDDHVRGAGGLKSRL
jgi:hypothetical protein